MFKCEKCGEELLKDEVVGLDCNGNEIDLDDLDNHFADPDYLDKVLCIKCYEEQLGNDNKI